MIIPLDRVTAIKALRTPYVPLRELALSFVSLSKVERECLIGCYIDDLTNEELAERLERSPKFVSRHRNAAVSRLCSAWGRVDKSLIDDMIDY